VLSQRQRSRSQAETLKCATIDLLETCGESITVQDVADRAGLSLRVLYRYFSGKDALLIAVIEDLQSRRAAELRRDLEAFSDPVDRLAEFLLRTIDYRRTPLNTALAKYTYLLAMSCPQDVYRAQAPFAALGTELVAAMGDAGAISRCTVARAAYLVMEMRRTYIHSQLFGAEFGLPLPTPLDLVGFCLRMLHVDETEIDRTIRRGAHLRASAHRDEEAS
jgi:AcrR family transcriptional regulator